MKVPFQGAIDCDIHPAVPGVSALLPYFDDYWRDQILTRYITKLPFTLTSYPPNAPVSLRPDWKPQSGLPGSSLDLMRTDALDPFGSRFAIGNVLHGSVALFSEDMGAAFCSAINDWFAKEWLDREPRLRGSILVHMENPEFAVAEIERMATDHRFVQVLLFASGNMPLGRRVYWPIYQAAEKHGLTICIHAGGLYRTAPNASGWPSYHVEDHVAQSAIFANQVVSLLSEGVFSKFPGLKVVLAEAGFTWLPSLLWRVNKTWRGVRTEVPWIDRPPAEIVRDHFRFTLQPVDAPLDGAQLARTMEHIGSEDLLLFSTDYPHYQFEGDEVLPDGLSDSQIRKLMVDNPLASYPRLRDGWSAATATRNKEAVQ